MQTEIKILSVVGILLAMLVLVGMYTGHLQSYRTAKCSTADIATQLHEANLKTKGL